MAAKGSETSDSKKCSSSQPETLELNSLIRSILSLFSAIVLHYYHFFVPVKSAFL